MVYLRKSQSVLISTLTVEWGSSTFWAESRSPPGIPKANLHIIKSQNSVIIYKTDLSILE